MLVAMLPTMATAQTAYAAEFLGKCDGQAWFIEEVERILNSNQMTINRLKNSSELDIIKSIGLKNKDIEGEIPRAIGELGELRTLFLSGNNLSGEIPAELFLLPKLYNIDISNNDYDGAIPVGFGMMVALETLILRGNAYTGSIHQEILDSVTIKVLDVSNNELSGAIPADLNKMTGLTYLAISDNNWDAGELPNLSALTKLIGLSAWSCNLTGEIPIDLYGLTKLQVLDLADNFFTGELSSSIENLKDLQLFAVGRNEIRGTIPDAFAALEKLEVIDLSENFLRGKIPDTLKARYDKGTDVYLQDNYFTGDVLKGMPNNEKNFTDGATSEQYQLIALSTVQINKDTSQNVYSLLQNKSYTDGNTTEKVRLNPDEYAVNYNDNKVEVTIESNGIFVTAKTEIPKSENFYIEIFILANDGSNYSTVKLYVTTDKVTGTDIIGGPEPTPSPSGDAHERYITGYPDGTFRPENSITREEIATMLIRALELDENLSTNESPFSDVASGRWSAPFIQKSKELEYLTGYPDGTFLPTSPMTRAELATGLVRILRVEGKATGTTSEFSDILESSWYYEFVQDAAAYGIVTGYSDGSFQPNKTVTRAEAVTMVNRMLGRNPETAPTLKTAECPFSDVARTHWAYLQVLEAALTHEH